jgi:hypothetical protein
MKMDNGISREFDLEAMGQNGYAIQKPVRSVPENKGTGEAAETTIG